MKLENVTINGVFTLEAARRDDVTFNMFLGPRDTRDLISMVTFTFTMRRHLIRLASAPFISFRLETLGWVRLLTSVCNAWQRSRTQNLRRVSENSGRILSRLSHVYEILRICRRPFVLSNALARLSISRFVQKIFAIKSQSLPKPNKCKFFGPQFLEGRPRLFCKNLLARFIVHRLVKFG